MCKLSTLTSVSPCLQHRVESAIHPMPKRSSVIPISARIAVLSALQTGHQRLAERPLNGRSVHRFFARRQQADRLPNGGRTVVTWPEREGSRARVQDRPARSPRAAPVSFRALRTAAGSRGRRCRFLSRPASRNRARRLWQPSPERHQQSRCQAAPTSHGRRQRRSGSGRPSSDWRPCITRRTARSGVQPRRCWRKVRTSSP